jgi:hypothetical protein
MFGRIVFLPRGRATVPGFLPNRNGYLWTHGGLVLKVNGFLDYDIIPSAARTHLF